MSDLFCGLLILRKKPPQLLSLAVLDLFTIFRRIGLHGNWSQASLPLSQGRERTATPKSQNVPRSTRKQNTSSKPRFKGPSRRSWFNHERRRTGATSTVYPPEFQLWGFVQNIGHEIPHHYKDLSMFSSSKTTCPIFWTSTGALHEVLSKLRQEIAKQRRKHGGVQQGNLLEVKRRKLRSTFLLVFLLFVKF